MPKKNSPIRLPLIDKILMVVTPLALIIIVGTSFFFIDRYKSEQVTYTYDSLTESGTNKALYFDDQLQFNLRLVQALTTFPDIYSMDREKQADFFSKRAAILGYSQFFVVDNNGISYYFNDQTEKDQSSEPFFENISSNETYITEPYYTKLGPIVTLCSAIYDESDQRVGTLCATFNITAIQTIIKDSTNSLTTCSFIINSEGRFIAVDSLGDASSQDSLFDDSSNDLAIISEAFESQANSTGIITLDGTEYYAAVVYMENTNWCLVEVTETGSIASHIKHIELIEFLFGIMMIIMLYIIFHIIYSWQKSFADLHTDPLCECGSRAGSLQLLKDLEKNSNATVGILYMDLNNFKYVNDTFGHEKGDEVLKLFAKVLVEQLGGLGYIGRIGGDEFIGIFKNIEKGKIDYAIEKIKSDLPVRSKGLYIDYEINVAFGYAEYKKNSGQTLHEVVRQADTNMYRNKAEFKNQ